MLWIVSVKAHNRATGMRVEGRYAASARTRDEAIALLTNAGLQDVSAVWVNENSWTVHGTKPAAP